MPRKREKVIDARASVEAGCAQQLGKQRAPQFNLARPSSKARFSRQNLAGALVLVLSLLLCVLVSAGIAGAASARAENHSASTTIQGQLSVSPGKAPILKTSTKDYRLGATTTYVLHTLQDNRLNGREIRAEGIAKPDGSFAVEKFFTIHNGKLYRVRYYCETCNIVALEPGRCECCQQPTELQEVPLNADQDTITVP